MARDLTAPEIAALGDDVTGHAAHARTHVRVEVEDAAGVYQDLTETLHSFGPFSTSIDQTVLSCTFRLARSHQLFVNSLSPLVTDALDAGRGLRLYITTLLHSAGVPASGDVRLVLDGVIDSVDAGAALIELVVRDRIGATLADAEILNLFSFFARDGGYPWEEILEEILGVATVQMGGPPFTPIVPFDPDPTGVTVLETLPDVTFPQQPNLIIEPGKLLEIMRTGAERLGWQLRPRWNETDGEFQLAFYAPPVDKTAVDWLIPADRYIAIPTLKVDRTDIRNAVRVNYFDAAAGARRTYPASGVPLTDAASVARFGYRFMELVEGDDSPIRTAAQAQALAELALSDLANPVVEMEVEVLMLWPVDIDDLVELEANDEQFTTNQILAVVGYTHEYGPKTERTRLQLRGKPTGGVAKWKRRIFAPPIVSPEQLAILSWEPAYTDPTGETVPYQGEVGSGVTHVLLYELVRVQGGAEPWSTIESVGALTSLTPVGRAIAHTYDVPAEGYVRYFRLRPIWLPGDGSVRVGNAIDGVVYPKSAQAPVVEEDDHETGEVGTYFIHIQDRGIPVVSVEMQTQVGDAPASDFTAPTRGPGGTSSIPGRGVLTAGQYEGDVVQDASRFSWVVFRVTLLTGEVLTFTSPGFDRNKVPGFLMPPTVNGTVISVRADADTKSIRVFKLGGPWNRSVAGREADIDVSLPDAASTAGHGANETAGYDVNIYSDPTADVDAYTLIETVPVVVTTGSAVAVALTVEVDPPSVGSADATIYVTGDTSPGGSHLTATWRYRVGGGAWSALASITSETTPAFGAIPTTRTGYVLDTELPRAAKPGPTDDPRPLVEVEVTVTAHDSGDDVIGKRTATQSWYMVEV